MMLVSATIAVGITFYLTRKMPDTYKSKARIATGLVDESEASVFDTKMDASDAKINLQFANLIQMMQLKKIVDIVSYQLIIHDMEHPDSAYRAPSKDLAGLNPDARKHALEVYKEKLKKREPLYLFDIDQRGIHRVMASMGYDEESLKKKLTIFRVSNSDFIDVEFESDNGRLSAFVVNALCKEFIDYYTSVVKENQIKAVNFLDLLLKQKREAMNSQTEQLKNYKIQNRVLNLNEQAKSLYGQIAGFTEKREMTEKDIIAFKGAIASIDNKFNPRDRQYLENTLTKINQDIIATKELLKRKNDEYIKTNFNPSLKVVVDSLQALLTNQINQSTDRYILNPLAAKESIVLQKLNLEVQLELAKNSIFTLDKMLAELNARFDKLVPHEAVIQSFESEIDIASKEYIEILKKYNQTSMESGFSLRLKQIDIAMPGTPIPAKRMILTIVSGMVVIVLYVVVLFVVFYLDESIKIAQDLADKTNLPVLGHLPLLKKGLLDLDKIWNANQTDSLINQYKDLLRSTRFEVTTELRNNHLLGITSLHAKEGKSFVALSLAYAFAKANKKVLLIDSNFDHNSITKITHAHLYIEDYLHNNVTKTNLITNDSLVVMGNKGGNLSAYELCVEAVLQEKLQELKQQFDVILIETPALHQLNKAKEWLTVCDKFVLVFEALQTITYEKNLTIELLKSFEKPFAGWILNKTAEPKSKLKDWLYKLKNRKTKENDY